MKSRFSHEFVAPSATPTGDDEAVLLLEASLREVAALYAIFKFKGRTKDDPENKSTVVPVVTSHRDTVTQHCAQYFRTHPKKRGEVALTKRTYELLEASRDLKAELRKAMSACRA